MEEIGLGSGVGSDGGFDLSSAPLQPIEQRFAFPAGPESSIEPGGAFGVTSLPAEPPAPNSAANFAGANGDSPATLPRPHQIADLKPLQAKIADSTACHAAIKVNMPLDQTKMEWLLSALAKTDCPMSCPHGRPVVLRYSIKEIEKAFHRI